MSAAGMGAAGCSRMVGVLLGGPAGQGLRDEHRLRRVIGAGAILGDESEVSAVARALVTWVRTAEPPLPGRRAVETQGKRLHAAAAALLSVKREIVDTLEALARDGALTPTRETLDAVAERIEVGTRALAWPREAITERLQGLEALRLEAGRKPPGTQLAALLAFERGEVLQ